MGIERRLTERLKSYWQQLCAGDSLPAFSKINPERIADLWPNCMALQLVNAQSRSLMCSYHYVGNQLQKLYGKDLSGTFDAMHVRDIPGWKPLKKLDEVIANPHVEEEDGHFINQKNAIVKYRACLLPFGSAQVVTHVLIGFSYKEFPR